MKRATARLAVLGTSLLLSGAANADPMHRRGFADTCERIAIDDELWLCTAANEVELHLRQRLVLHRSPLAALEARMLPGQFVRVHRDVQVRRTALSSLVVDAVGNHAVCLHNGAQVRVSESYLKAVRGLFS